MKNINEIMNEKYQKTPADIFKENYLDKLDKMVLVCEKQTKEFSESWNRIIELLKNFGETMQNFVPQYQKDKKEIENWVNFSVKNGNLDEKQAKEILAMPLKEAQNLMVKQEAGAEAEFERQRELEGENEER